MEPKKMYFEDLDANTQEVLLDLIASMVEHKIRNKAEEERVQHTASGI